MSKTATSAAVAPVTAFAVAALGIGLFSVMDAFMKSLTLALGVYNAILWRNLLSVGLGYATWRIEGATRPGARAMRLHLIRGGIAAVMGLLFFWGLARVPMAPAITLAYIAPLLALLLGAVLLGERVGPRVVAASVAALGGVGIVMLGQARSALGDDALLGAGAILVSAVLYAVNLVVARMQSQAASPGEIAFFQSGVISALFLLAAPWLLAVPPQGEWPKIVICALLATASLWCLGWAYAHGDTGYLAMTEYTSFVYAAALGWLVFAEALSPYTIAGAGVIVAACLWGARAKSAMPAAVEVA